MLAELGYDGLTIDKVAARAGAARATVYRRWPTKADLVLAAVERLATGDVDASALPDTGDLRADLVAMVLPQSEQEADLRMKVLAGVASLALQEEPRLAQAASTASTGPWTAALGVVLQRAVDRGEVLGGDVATLAEVVPAACLARAVTGRSITREFSLALIDAVLLPAMRAGR